MLKFLRSKYFFFHLGLALLVVALAIGGAYYFLLSYTEPDKIVEVPDLNGFDLLETENVLKDQNLRYEIVDSLYLEKIPGGTIVDQDPLPGSIVKHNRKIYLSISRYQPPKIKLPQLKDLTLPLAIAKLNSYGLKLAPLQYEPSECINCIVRVKVKDKTVEEGTKLQKGTTITLVVGEGETGQRVKVPMLYGLTPEEARILANKYGLNIGAAPCLQCETEADSLAAVVYRQEPSPEDSIQVPLGSSLRLYLTSDLEMVPRVNIDSIKALLN